MPERAITHQVRVDAGDGVVTKRYTSWDRGEPAREWTALTLLARHQPGLAASPVRTDFDDGNPVIVMTRLPGAPLGDQPLSTAQREALSAALLRLWHAVPATTLRLAFPPPPNSVRFARQVRRMLVSSLPLSDPPLSGRPPVGPPPVEHARRAAARWLDGTVLGVDESPSPDGTLVLGQGDSNLANFLWDGSEVRIVDFEDAGLSDRAFELAVLVEHISAWSDCQLDAESLLSLFDLTEPERVRTLRFRRLAALFWLLMLSPGSPASLRNPAGTQERQAERLLTLLG